MSAKSNSGSKDALELNRLAGGLTTASGLYFVALARVPYSFTSSADPLVYEPEVAIPVAAFASWVFSLYTSSRLRAWWRQDLNDATVNQEEAPEDKSPELSMVDVDRSERSYWPLINAFTVPLAATPFLSTAAFLLGAPLIFKSHLTVLSCLYLAVLALTPASMTLPAPWSSQSNFLIWVRIFSAARPKTRTETALLVQAYSTIIGAVLGAIPTALDWGRVWQTWPVTVLWGAFFGNMLGAVSALIVAGLPENLDKPRPAKKKAGSDVVNAATKSSGKKQR